MRRTIVLAAVAVAAAAILLIRLEQTAELLAWEGLLLLLLIVLFRLLPKPEPDSTPPLFGAQRRESPRPPRSVASYELAAVHAMSESPGADRRLTLAMQRIAAHRLRKRDIDPDSDRASELVAPVLFAEARSPLTEQQITTLIEQLENL